MAYLGGTTGICRVFPFMASTNYDFVEQVDVFSMQYNTIPCIPVYLCVWWCKVWETGCHPISVRSNMEGISLFFYGKFILRGLFFDYQYYWLEQKNFSTIALPTHSLGLNIHWTCTWWKHVEPSKNGMIKAYQGRISGHRQDPLTSCISCPKRMAAPMPTSTSLIQFSPLGRCWNWGWFVYLWYFVGTIYIYI